MSKIYDQLKRAQQSKREAIPLDLLASVMENPSCSTAITTPRPESQLKIAEEPPSQDVGLLQELPSKVKDIGDVIQLTTTAAPQAESQPKIIEPPASQDGELTQGFSSKVKGFIGKAIQLATTAERRLPTYSRWLVLSLVGVVLLTVGLFRLRPRHPKDPIIGSDSSDNASISLRSERAGADWRVSWNRSAPALKQAMGAHVSITDGALQKEFDLGPGELRNGSLIYSPASDNVLVQLRLNYPDSKQTTSEWVRIVAGSPPQALSRQEAVGSPIGHAVSRTAPPPTVLRDSQLKVATVNRTEPTVTINERPEVAHPSTSNSSGEEKSVASTRTDTVTEPTPRTAVSPLVTVPSTMRATDEKISESLPESSAAGPTIPPSTAKGLEPAELLQGKKPDYPFIARQSNIRGNVVVHFRISSTGEVQNVSVVKGSPLLVNSAVQAVKAWRYKPARLNGMPVDSEGDITFNFN